jgi:hypothetical protein
VEPAALAHFVGGDPDRHAGDQLAELETLDRVHHCRVSPTLRHPGSRGRGHNENGSAEDPDKRLRTEPHRSHRSIDLLP